MKNSWRIGLVGGSVLLDFVLDAFIVGVFPLERSNLLLNLLEDDEEGRHDEHLENHTDEHTSD